MLENYLNDTSKYEAEEEIAKGNFGKVFKCDVKNQRDNRIAIKRIPVNSEDLNIHRFLLRELSIISNLKHPSFIRFFGFSLPSKKKKNFKILPLFQPNKALLDIQQKDKERDEDEKILNATIKSKIAYGVAYAISYLRKNNVVHRDLRPENIFIHEEFNPTVPDYRLSKFYEEN